MSVIDAHAPSSCSSDHAGILSVGQRNDKSGWGFEPVRWLAYGGRIDFIAFDPVSFGYDGVFESAVLNQFGVKSSVPRMVDLLEKDAVQRRGYVCAALRASMLIWASGFEQAPNSKVSVGNERIRCKVFMFGFLLFGLTVIQLFYRSMGRCSGAMPNSRLGCGPIVRRNVPPCTMSLWRM